jgi:hypothetical protein
MLDEWRGLWSPLAEKKYNRIGLTSQPAFLGYLKRFFRYAVRIELFARNPAQELRPISKSKRRTQILNPPQFQQLLAAISRYTAANRGMDHEFAAEFRALFLLQRWSGTRLLDCLMLPRKGLTGENLILTTKKTRALNVHLKAGPPAAKVSQVLLPCATTCILEWRSRAGSACLDARPGPDSSMPVIRPLWVLRMKFPTAGTPTTATYKHVAREGYAVSPQES